NVGEVLSTEPAQLVAVPALAAAAGDIDADGYDDLVVGTGEDAPAALHLNIENPKNLHSALTESVDARRGLSTLSLALGDALANTGAALADFDGDGDLDAVVANESAEARLFVNAGGGALTPRATISSAGAATPAVGASDVDW